MTASDLAPTSPLLLDTRLTERVWGGSRLKQLGQTGEDGPIGEAWAVYEGNRIQTGPFAGQSLGDLTARFPAELLGTQAKGSRFPLLIKLLDCADWLSVQVHPNNEQAAELEGAGELGKTEAWHILEAEAGAELIAGIREGTDADDLKAAILRGDVMDYAERWPVGAGDTVMMPAGTLHALGPGLLLYEVQQTSDTTYRVYDWDRPASAGRALHLEKSAAVTTTNRAQPEPAAAAAPGQSQVLTSCPYFVLERFSGPELLADTQGQSFHAITVMAGEMTLQAGAERLTLGALASVVVPAAAGAYRLSGEFQALRSRLP
ncbi:class I mannose-6-phosphate isomerase [Deinococcus sp. Arct2-2]|uniref:type I phosphomannose isomerase catalytic subunit n=1 Tax=Deinococcus sp. Arct2-2 TaxID=2568653 RepID=UPI0010A520ED|nr:type I phosphomannose isomerase catalytic subunit [Deinococcus sp. Arct2-2]THF71709.1 class I mannose-6-phosphate isomerase [Deinococcus sp. Arct2-2]